MEHILYLRCGGVPPPCTASVPTSLALPSGFLGTKQGADGAGTCTAASACTQPWGRSILPTRHPPPQKKTPLFGCRNPHTACGQVRARAPERRGHVRRLLRQRLPSPQPPLAARNLGWGHPLDTSSSPKPMRNAQTGGAGLHTNGARARREAGKRKGRSQTAAPGYPRLIYYQVC